MATRRSSSSGRHQQAPAAGDVHGFIVLPVLPAWPRRPRWRSAAAAPALLSRR